LNQVSVDGNVAVKGMLIINFVLSVVRPTHSNRPELVQVRARFRNGTKFVRFVLNWIVLD